MGLTRGGAPAWSVASGPSDEVRELVERLLKERADARAARDFARSDALRDGFAAAGLKVMDTGDGTDWELTPEFDQTNIRLVAVKAPDQLLDSSHIVACPSWPLSGLRTLR